MMLIAIATLSKPVRLAMRGMDVWRKRRLDMALREAQARLGEQMVAAGIDDGELGAKILDLDRQLQRANAVGASTQALKAARCRLVLQLADAALAEDVPLPGADTEYRRARQAQTALQMYETGTR